MALPDRLVEQISSLELVVKELQDVAHNAKQQANTANEALEREREVKTDLLNEVTQLQTQLASVSEEANSLQGEIVLLRKQIKEPQGSDEDKGKSCFSHRIILVWD